ncbi:MAG: NAD(P)H-dependent glycerol-3-phosphate dehydrogenase [Rhizobiales bacterium]|nr:NAD(P)H-dependent glycerol-3-phosphate dehydrogenase [Hyphomicrobiales bacterium]
MSQGTESSAGASETTGFTRVGVVGAGAWGTALAISLARAGRQVTLWTRHEEHAARIRESGHSDHLPDVGIAANIRATSEARALAGLDVLLLAMPAQHMRSVATDVLAAILSDGTPLVGCAKGIEVASGKLMHEVVAECLPAGRYAVLSGPSFADEVARGLPAAVTLASRDAELAAKLAHAMASPSLRIYWTDDVVGVEVAGALKNVLAIAAGIVAGRHLGASAHAGLVTRGFAELSRLACALGARADTLTGLAGLGDLMLTCSNAKSRNMSLGLALAEGRGLEEVLGARRAVSEGVATALAADAMARKLGLDLPITAAVAMLVRGEINVDGAIGALLARPLRGEAG